MRSKRVLLAMYSLLLFGPLTLISQYNVSGKVINSDGNAMPFVNIILHASIDSSVLTGTVSETDGYFLLDRLETGSYFMSASFIGYQQQFSKIFEIQKENHSVEIAPLVLYEDTFQLEEVLVKAKKPIIEQKIDRMVVNVENSITSAGSSALDVLERSPGVIVNRSNNSLSMGGKEGIIVMINNKISRMPISAVVQMLEGMSAGDIKNIELISTPPANFDAEGDAGIINIVLKKNSNMGVNGSHTLTTGYGKGEQLGANLSINHRTDKFNLFGSYSYTHDNTEQQFTNFRNIEYLGIKKYTSTVSVRDPIIKVHNARIGFDYDLSEKTILGMLVSGYDNKWAMTAFNDIQQEENGMLVSSVGSTNDEVNQWKNLLGNVNLRHAMSENESLNFDFDYVYYHDNNPTNYSNEYFDATGHQFRTEEVRSGKITPIHIWVGKFDYSNKISEKVKWESGLKAAFSRFNNDISVESLMNDEWVFDPEFTQEYELKEDIWAAYTSFDLKLSDKISAKAGLRFEHTISNLSTSVQEGLIDRKYGELFPSLFFSYQLNEENVINLSYSRRISRPSYRDLAPFVIFLDPTTFLSGNSELQPSITNHVKADYRFKSYLISLQYSHDADAIARFQPKVDPETNRQVTSAENLDSRKTYSLTLSLPFTVNNWWEMQNNLIGIWQKAESSFEGKQNFEEQQAWMISGSQIFTLPKDFTFEISGFYRSPALFGVAKTKHNGVVNLGLQKILSKNSSLRFTIDDLLETLQWSFEIHDPSIGLDLSGAYLFSNRTYKLSFTHNFGNSKAKSGKERKTGSEEERRRGDN